MNEFDIVTKELDIPFQVRLYSVQFELKDYAVLIGFDPQINTGDYLSIYVPSRELKIINPKFVDVLNRCRKERQLNNFREVATLYKFAKGYNLITVGDDDIQEITLYDTAKANNVPRYYDFDNYWSVYNKDDFPDIKAMVITAYRRKFYGGGK